MVWMKKISILMLFFPWFLIVSVNSFVIPITQHIGSIYYSLKCNNILSSSPKNFIDSSPALCQQQQVCIVDDNSNPITQQMVQDVSKKLAIPIVSDFSHHQGSIPFSHVLSFVPYPDDKKNKKDQSNNIYALAIQQLEETKDSSSSNSKKRTKLFKTKPFFIDLCPSKHSKLGRRLSGKDGGGGGGGGGGDLLLKAVMPSNNNNNNNVIIYDLTAGLAQDSLLLAQSSRTKHVCMVERNSIVAALLQDALCRLQSTNSNNKNDNINDNHTSNLHHKLSLYVGDSISFLHEMNQFKLAKSTYNNNNNNISTLESFDTALYNYNHYPPHVIYLDPMFPSRTKSAAVKKNMQILHGLLNTQKMSNNNNNNNDDQTKRQIEEQTLLELSMQVATNRVVVKRPIKAPSLGNGTITPSYSLDGSINRWDVYLLL